MVGITASRPLCGKLTVISQSIGFEDAACCSFEKAFDKAVQ